MKASSILRSMGALGAVGALALGLSTPAMAQTISNPGPSSEGTITITTTSNNAGTATWTWSGLTKGMYVTVAVAPKSNPSNYTVLPAPPSGTVSTSGTYSASITLPTGDTWQNTEIEMSAAEFQVGSLPEVPWAAALPLLMIVPLGYTLWKRRVRPSN